jgi:hypothetical protein
MVGRNDAAHCSNWGVIPPFRSTYSSNRGVRQLRANSLTTPLPKFSARRATAGRLAAICVSSQNAFRNQGRGDSSYVSLSALQAWARSGSFALMASAVGQLSCDVGEALFAYGRLGHSTRSRRTPPLLVQMRSMLDLCALFPWISAHESQESPGMIIPTSLVQI